jgi:hypothetical protein
VKDARRIQPSPNTKIRRASFPATAVPQLLHPEAIAAEWLFP